MHYPVPSDDSCFRLRTCRLVPGAYAANGFNRNRAFHRLSSFLKRDTEDTERTYSVHHFLQAAPCINATTLVSEN